MLVVTHSLVNFDHYFAQKVIFVKFVLISNLKQVKRQVILKGLDAADLKELGS